MITVELEPHELHMLINAMEAALLQISKHGGTVADMKAMLARIEYLEGLKSPVAAIPDNFLGRCRLCLDNAYIGKSCDQVSDPDCLVGKAGLGGLK